MTPEEKEAELRRYLSPKDVQALIDAEEADLVEDQAFEIADVLRSPNRLEH